jgi:hypothetical protein
LTRVLVCGGRNLNPHRVSAWLHEHAEMVIGSTPSFIIEGAARGADTGPPTGPNTASRPATSATRRCSPRASPTWVLAFPGGKGTQMMVRLAERADVRVIEAQYRD